MIDQHTNHMEYQPGMEQIDSDIQDTVISRMNQCDFDSYTAADVRRALQKDVLSPEDFAALLSPAADPFLEEMAHRAQQETRKHFGNSVMMFTPCTLPTTAKITASTAALTATTKFAGPSSTPRKWKRK